MTPREIELSADYLKDCEKNFDIRSREFVDKFVSFIQTVQKGNLYMGCEYGTYRTDYITLLDMLFNPQRDDEQECIDDIYFYAIELYDKLTPEDKAKMGWSEEFDKNFMPKIKEINDYYDNLYSSMYEDD